MAKMAKMGKMANTAKMALTRLISSPVPLFTSATLLRAALLLYGLWQDAHSPLKYTDIDYHVFTDAARLTFTSSNPPRSPYLRETYRYTPLLAWLLYPTTLPGLFCFSSGKILFALADLAAGWLMSRILRRHGGMAPQQACRYASIWLLNPMVATISTRGSSEGLLGVLVMALLWAVLERRVGTAGVLLGLAVHLKIYPFIYAPAIFWWMDGERMTAPALHRHPAASRSPLRKFFTRPRLTVTLASLATLCGLNVVMWYAYGADFVQHTFLHHLTRLDHRHNFSPYNTALYLASAAQVMAAGSTTSSTWTSSSVAAEAAAFVTGIERIAFLPQLLLSTVFIPLVGAKKDLPTTMLAQTFAFVAFNKVCTSQYFLWYLILLPLHLPKSSLVRRPILGISGLALWLGSQLWWLQQAFQLEFLGRSTFVPGLWYATLAFFLVNCWLLGIVIDDLAELSQPAVDGLRSG